MVPDYEDLDDIEVRAGLFCYSFFHVVLIDMGLTL
jgi:hypothetical protein